MGGRRDLEGEKIQKWFRKLVDSHPEGLLSPGGAAQYLGVSRQRVHQLINAGKLAYFQYGQSYGYVPTRELRRLKAERGKDGTGE